MNGNATNLDRGFGGVVGVCRGFEGMPTKQPAADSINEAITIGQFQLEMSIDKKELGFE